jgi:hypothetical protein
MPEPSSCQEGCDRINDMQERTLQGIREKVRRRQYVMTLHADEEMGNDELTIVDVENAILTGRIAARQRDWETAESKYVIRGLAIDGVRTVTVVVKRGATDKLVIITVYAD